MKLIKLDYIDKKLQEVENKEIDIEYEKENLTDLYDILFEYSTLDLDIDKEVYGNSLDKQIENNIRDFKELYFFDKNSNLYNKLLEELKDEYKIKLDIPSYKFGTEFYFLNKFDNIETIKELID